MDISCLDRDEAVIMQVEDVTTETNRIVDLVLTNKNIIQVKKGIVGPDRHVEKYPLVEFRILNGKANILVERNSRGRRQIDFYFNDFKKLYYIEGVPLCKKFVAAIIKAHRARIDEAFISVNNEKNGRFAAIKKKIKAVNRKVPAEEPSVQAYKCPICGAELRGKAGEIVECSYCETTVLIK